jgi:UMF1 family MFS transporter
MLFEGSLMVRISFIITGIYFAAFTVPLFLWLRERTDGRELPKGENYLSVGFRQTWSTLRAVRDYGEFIKFVAAFLIYNDGVIMALNFAAIIGDVLFGMGQQDLIIFVILVQVTNVFGAYAFGALTEKFDVKRSLILSIFMMVGVVIWMFFARTVTVFYIIGALAGFAMAGVQSVSRAMVGVLMPQGQSAEFYGFFAVAGRTSSFIGPVVYGAVAKWGAQYYESLGRTTQMAEQLGQRWGILSIAVFLMIGLFLLFGVNEHRVRHSLATSQPE